MEMHSVTQTNMWTDGHTDGQDQEGSVQSPVHRGSGSLQIFLILLID